jgi:ABC-type Fe3+-siderophore transport system permease subunit
MAMRLWSGVFAGPFAFALVFELKYALVDYACRNRAQWLFWIFFLGGMAICAYGVFEAWRGMEPSPRARFMGLSGVALSTAFAVFIVALMVPDLFLRPCQ